MPRPKGRGAARQNKRADGNLKSAWAGGNYHNKAEEASGSSSESGLEEAGSPKHSNISMR